MVFTDAINNKYIGDCLYSNADVANASRFYFQGEDPANWNAEMTTLLTDLGVSFSSVAANLTTTGIIYKWTPVGDTTANATSKRFETRKGTSDISRMFNNAGTSILAPTISSAATSSFFAVTGNTQSIAMFNMVLTGTRTISHYTFWYQAQLADVNTFNSGYYSNDIINHSVTLIARGTSSTFPVMTTNAVHYIVGASKIILNTGNAVYGISCSDAQTPTYTIGWATDAWFLDNNMSLGYPYIGRAPNLLLANGIDYVIGRPTRFGTNQVALDGGYNSWIPVCTFANKTLLMRCYSSSIII